MILLDHCVPQRYLDSLRDWGYQADLSVSYIPENAPDGAVIALATQLDAVLLTTDLDFSNITNYPPQQYQGIILLRDKFRDVIANGTLKTVLTDLYRDKLRHTLIVISRGRYRIRN
jgi:predicted nuclease of predicted toxin-antitoxin system